MQTLARDRLITEHLPYTGAIAENLMKEFNLHGVVPEEDVLGYARIGLTQAAGRFSPDRGAKFATFSFPRIRGAIVEGLRKSNRARGHHRVHQEASAGTPFSVRSDRASDVLPAHAVDPFEQLEARSLHKVVLKAVRELPDLERQVILLFYFEDLDRDRIAERLGHTPSYIGRLRHRALRTLSTSLEAVANEHGHGGSR
jgi:RNA polymerase sigma factor for flagellar operon FliA